MPGLMVMVRRQLRVNRTSLVVMTVLLAVNNAVQIQAYQSAFPDAHSRATLLSDLAGNTALRALYGYPYDVGSATGYLAWRGMSSAALLMAMWGAFITVGALRGEEEAGRGELALSQPQSRRLWFLAALVAVTIETLVIGAVSLGVMAAVALPQGLMTVANCAALTLQLMLPALVFAALGGVTSQLLGTTRAARIAAAAVLAVALLVRTAADTGSGIGWLRWTTPLGWFEELHPSLGPAPGALLASAASAVILALLALPMLAMRDIGLGLLPHRDSRAPRRFLLATPWQAALRDALPQLSIWLAGALSYALLLGALTKAVLDFYTSNATLGGLLGASFGLSAYVTAAFSVVQLIVVMLVATLVVSARGDEASGRLELLLAAPVARLRWILSRTLLAVVLGLALALASAAALWAGAAMSGQDVGLGSVLEAASNCLPLIVICAGGAAAVLALAPRAVVFVYVPIVVAYLWEAIGSALKAPSWMLDISPFHALAAVPLEHFAVVPAAVLTGIGLALLALAGSAFRGRDLLMG